MFNRSQRFSSLRRKSSLNLNLASYAPFSVGQFGVTLANALAKYVTISFFQAKEMVVVIEGEIAGKNYNVSLFFKKNKIQLNVLANGKGAKMEIPVSSYLNFNEFEDIAYHINDILNDFIA